MTVCPNLTHNLSWRANGTVTPCNNLVGFVGASSVGEMLTSIQYQRLVQDHSQDRKSIHCQRCWDKERIGLVSKRLTDTKLHEIYHRIDQDYVKIDGAIGSKCNAACRICNAESSTLWQKILDTPLDSADTTIWTEVKQRLDHVMQMDFGGGEPWINDIEQQTEIFDDLLRRGRSHLVKIRYNTNGSIWPKRLIKLLENFRQVEITLSLDDIGERFEYNRWPLRWHSVQQNIERLLELKSHNHWISLTVNFTVSVFSWLREKDFTEWCQQQGLGNINYNILHEPAVYSIKSLPEDTLDKVGIKTRFDDLVSSAPMTNWREEFVALTSQLDKQRQQYILDIFPELRPVI